MRWDTWRACSVAWSLALQARTAELRAIYDIGRTISASIDLNETTASLAESLRSAIPYDAAEISLFDEAQGRLALVHAVGGEARGASAHVTRQIKGCWANWYKAVSQSWLLKCLRCPRPSRSRCVPGASCHRGPIWVCRCRCAAS